MKLARFFLTGIFFGIVLTKAEAVSWYRIYEMFHFQSFHMFGIIGMALFTGVIGLQIIKRYKQLCGLGFDACVYFGGLFEWLLLQEIYGISEFPIEKRGSAQVDALKYAPARKNQKNWFQKPLEKEKIKYIQH